jgi:hypothetical protein
MNCVRWLLTIIFVSSIEISTPAQDVSEVFLRALSPVEIKKLFVPNFSQSRSLIRSKQSQMNIRRERGHTTSFSQHACHSLTVYSTSVRCHIQFALSITFYMYWLVSRNRFPFKPSEPRTNWSRT